LPSDATPEPPTAEQVAASDKKAADTQRALEGVMEALGQSQVCTPGLFTSMFLAYSKTGAWGLTP
jgi:xanthine dehydrogenase iron-sulfur cluster and FAD-binding subunit A